ncbi:MAG: HYR domain-containing protein [Saprospiraceae bacterium]
MSFLHNLNLKITILGLVGLWSILVGNQSISAQCPTSVSVVAVEADDVCLGATVYYFANVVDGTGPFTYAWCAYNNSTGSGTCFDGFDDSTSATPLRSWVTSAGAKSVQVSVSQTGCPTIISPLHVFNAITGPARILGTVTDTICEVENPVDLTEFEEDFTIASGTFEYSIKGVAIADPTAYTLSKTDTVLVTFTDDAGCGNTSTLELVLLSDDPAPVVICPDDLVIQLRPLQCDSLITFDDAEATDECTPSGDIDLESDITSGTVLGIGTTVVTFTATDGSENESTCSFNITVREYTNANLGCKPVQVSVDDNCEATLTATLVLTGYEDGDDILLGCDASWDINVISALGNPLGDVVNASLVGKTLMYSIENVNSGWRCMHTVTIEDKLAPSITCRDVTVSCLADIASIETSEAEDNCTAVAILVNEVHTPTNCEAYIGTITRTYIAEDLYGNKSIPCTSTIYLNRSSVVGVTSPSNVVLQCSDIFDADDKGFGYPAPSETGVPTLGSYPLYPTSQLSTLYCNAVIDYEDRLVVATKCKTRIIRTWKIVEWWCSSTVELFVGMQMIDIIDDTAPIIPDVQDITLSTKSTSCDAVVNVPSLTITDNCQGIQQVYVNAYNTADDTPTGYINGNGGKLTLPVGVHKVEYTAIDECGNIGTKFYTVTIRDNTSPLAVCDQLNTVSLKGNGYTEITASSVDDGSSDECSAVTVKIRRVDDPCGYGQTEDWLDKVGFCCADANTSPMVQLLVTDAGGNTNMCMVSVKVQDKITASMTCPDNIVINDCSYTFDENDPDFYFNAPELFDNCPANLTVANDISDNRTSCGIGEIVRTITLSQGTTVLQTCVQTISVTNPTPFDGDTAINWPDNYTVLGQCEYDGLVPESLPVASAYPTYDEGTCDLIGHRYEDEVFPFTTNGACYKIIRTWTIIDWCQTDTYGNVKKWTYEQEIKVMDNTAPVIAPQADYYECSFDPACEGGYIDVAATATDCTPSSELKWSYIITQDGDFYASGNQSSASGTYPIGIYHIVFTAEDRCGNQSELEFNFEVRNCKSPVAVCKKGLAVSLVLMDTDEGRIPMAMLSPEFFDNKSEHPCDNYDVSLSFSEDLEDVLKTFDCDNLGENVIELWVTDQNGNTSFCSTFVDIQDNEYLCSQMSEFWGCNTVAATCSPGNFNNNSQAFPENYVLAIVKNDNTCDFADLTDWGPNGTTYEDKIYHGPGVEWTLGNLGTVDALAIDNDGYIYAAATTVFGSQVFPDGTTPNEQRGSGSIYKIDPATGAVNTAFVTTRQATSYDALYPNSMPNQTISGNWGGALGQAWSIKTGAGLGDLTFDSYNNFLFASNFEDGKIYKIDPATGSIVFVYDPRFGDASSSGLDNGSSGFAPLGQRPWGLGVVDEDGTIKLYYSLWNADLRHNVSSNTRVNQIWSVSLDGSGNPIASTESLELTLPILTGGTTYYMSNPVADIAFNTSGEMLLAERGMIDDFGIPYHTTGVNPAHKARILRYQNAGMGWDIYNGTSYYAIGTSGSNSSGGIDFGTYTCDGETICDDMIWSTVDAFNIDGNLSVYGVVAVNYGESTFDSHKYVDLSSDLGDFSKLGIGDVEAYNCACSDSGRKPVIAGSITNANDISLTNVEVILDGTERIQVLTNDKGEYTFGEKIKGADYKIHASKNNDILNGVSTLDLVFIQRHILGIETLTSPYAQIAADINNNRAITVGDLSELRKVILGEKSSFTNNTSWRFIDKGYHFLPDEQPLTQAFTELYNIDNLSNDMNINFVAVKIGDLNNNAVCNSNTDIVDSRGNASLVIADMPIVKGEIYTIDITNGQSGSWAGLQSKFIANNLAVLDIAGGSLDITAQDYRLVDGILTIAYPAQNLTYVLKDDKLFSITFKALANGKLSEMVTLSNDFSNEAYFDDDLKIQKLTLRVGETVPDFTNVSVIPNPWSSQTLLSFTTENASNTVVSIYDNNGRMVYQKESYLGAGQQNYVIDRNDLPNTGVYMYEIKSGTQLNRGKMIIVE